MSSPLLTKQCDKVTPECPVSGTIYGFYPSVGWNAFACAIFATCTIAQLIIGIRKRTWSYLLAVSLGCLLETTGSIGMLLLSANPYSTRGFQLEIVCLTTAPAFLAAGIYLTLQHVVRAFGPHLSLLRPPALHTWLFVACDVVSIALQAGGSALAARQDVATIETAVNLIVAGMAFQVATLGIFFVCAALFFVRAWRRRDELSPEAQPLRRERRFRLMLGAILLAFLCILVRCVFRLVEFEEGWRGPIMTDQTNSIAMDTCMIMITVIAQTAFHPGYCFSVRRNSASTEGNELNTRASGDGEDRKTSG